LLNHLYPVVIKQVVFDQWQLDLIIVHQVNSSYRFFIFYCLNIGGGGGGGWFSNFFPGGNGGFGRFFGGAPGAGDTRRRQPPPPGFRTDFTDLGNDGAGKLNI
jgi:hypothetical protein